MRDRPGGPEQTDELIIDDPRVLEALYDPLRYRLFRLMRSPRSIRELADEIGLPADRLYYHVRVLERVGMVKRVDARAVGRHTERVYGHAAKRITFSGDVTLAGSSAGGVSGMLRGIVEELDGALRAHESGTFGSNAPGLLAWHIAPLTPARALQLERRLKRLIGEYFNPRVRATARTSPFGILAALTQLPEPGRRAPTKGRRR